MKKGDIITLAIETLVMKLLCGTKWEGKCYQCDFISDRHTPKIWRSSARGCIEKTY